MKKMVALFAVVLALTLGIYSVVYAVGEKVIVQGEDYVAEDGGTVEVIEGRVDAIGNTFRMWDKADHWLEWKFIIPADGKYIMAVRYAAGAQPPIRKIEVDGKTLLGFEAYQFQLTGGWCKEENQWVNYVLRTGGQDALFNLKAGTHVLRMTNLGEEDNGMNIDSFAFLSPEIKPDILGVASVAQEK